MSQASNQTEPAAPSTRPLVTHSLRQQWGRGLFLWEREGKRALQFEDGSMRVFAEDYYDLLQPAAKPDPQLRQRLRQAALDAGHEIATPKGAKGKKKGRRPAAPQPTLEDQVTLFEDLFDESMQTAAWTEQMRNRKGRRLKRHRDPAIAEAAEVLAKPALQACIDEERYAEVFTRVLDVVGKTDLVTKSQLKVLQGVEVDRELAEAMVAYLYRDQTTALDPMARLRRALARVDVRKIPWNLLTAPLALLHPADELCVHPTSIRAQAKVLMPGFKLGPNPNARDYARVLEMAMSVHEHLAKAGLQPRDLLDVAGFIKVTMRRKHKADLQAAMVSRTSPTTD